MSFNLIATNCPAPTYPTAPPSVSGCTGSTTTAPHSPYLPVPGDATSLALPFNELAAIAAGGLSFGGHGYGIINGLTLATGSGLALAVAAGNAFIGAVIEYAGGMVTVPDATANVFVWLSQTGTLSVTSTVTPPGANYLYIGNCTTSGGNVTAVDYSGVLYIIGSASSRTTGDTGAPGDSPGIIGILTVTLGGCYLWDGNYHRPLGRLGRTAITLAGTALTLTSAQSQGNFLDVSGTPGGAAILTVPLIAGLQYTVRNGVSGGYAITIQGASGSGVAIANGKTAIIICDGTNYIRVSADV